MKYALLYKPKNQYLYLKDYGLDTLNIGINPKLYNNRNEAETALKKQLPFCLDKQLRTNSNRFFGLEDHAKPAWYDDRHTKKLTEKQKNKLEWYENAVANCEKQKKFLEEFNFEDVEIVEIYESKDIYI